MIIKALILGLIFQLSLSKRQFPIGVIFNGPDDENEIAFRSAIDRINMHERRFEFQPIIKYISIDDSFIIEQAVCDLVAQKVIAIFGPSSTTSGFVRSISALTQIPNLIYEWKLEYTMLEREQPSSTLNLHPDSLTLGRAISDIIRAYSWKSYTIIYETNEHLMQLQDVLQLHEPTSNPVTVRQLDEEPDQRPLLKDIKTSGESTYILHCSLDRIVDILRQAREVKMLEEYQSFFIPSLDTNTIDFEEIVHTQANITTIKIIDPTNFEVKNAVHDWQQNEKRLGRQFHVPPERIKTQMILMNDALWILARALSELDYIEQLTLPNTDCKRPKPWAYGRSIYEFMKSKVEELATGRIEFDDYGQRTYFTVHVVMLTPEGFEETAVWNSVNSLNQGGAAGDAMSKKIVEKIQNKTFIISSRIGAPFLMRRNPEEGQILEGNARYEGYSMDLIDSIAKHLGFTYIFELTPDGRYGGYNKETKKWDGLIKQLLDGKADLAICDLTITSTRRTAVDFSSPFMTLGISILYAKPVNNPPNLFSFLSPFSLEVWLYMATAYIVMSLLLYVLARIAPDDWENPHPCNSEPEELENLWAISNTTWLTMGSLMGQGCDILPKAISTRLVTGMWWFFALMMLNSYTANLAAFLTMSRMDAAIESADDLAKQSKIKYGAVIGGSTISFFKESNFSIYQRMWAAMEGTRPTVFTKSNDEGVDRVIKGKGMYAFLMESTTLEYIIERNCELMQVGGWLDYKSYGIAMPFNSPYRKLISEAVLKLGESGVLAELKRRWWKEKYGGGSCAGDEMEAVDANELGVDNVGGVFLVLGIGLFVSFLIGLVEFLWNIKDVALEEKLTPLEVLKAEVLFAMKFWVTVKPVKHSSSMSGSLSSKRSSKRSSKSRSRAASESRSTNTNALQNSLAYSSKSLPSEKGKAFSLKSLHLFGLEKERKTLPA